MRRIIVIALVSTLLMAISFVGGFMFSKYSEPSSHSSNYLVFFHASVESPVSISDPIVMTVNLLNQNSRTLVYISDSPKFPDIDIACQYDDGELISYTPFGAEVYTTPRVGPDDGYHVFIHPDQLREITIDLKDYFVFPKAGTVNVQVTVGDATGARTSRSSVTQFVIE